MNRGTDQSPAFSSGGNARVNADPAGPVRTSTVPSFACATLPTMASPSPAPGIPRADRGARRTPLDGVVDQVADGVIDRGGVDVHQARAQLGLDDRVRASLAQAVHRLAGEQVQGETTAGDWHDTLLGGSDTRQSSGPAENGPSGDLKGT